MNDEYAGGAGSVDMGSIMNAGSTNTSAGSLINSLSILFVRSIMVVHNKDGKQRFSGSIVLKNNKMQEMVRYTFRRLGLSHGKVQNLILKDQTCD